MMELNSIHLNSTELTSIHRGNSLVWQKSDNSKKIRYIRDTAKGSTENIGSFWVEIQAIKNNSIVSFGKPASCNFLLEYGYAGMITDGDINTNNYCGINTPTTDPSFIIVDLELEMEIDCIKIWHYYDDGRSFYNTKTEVSNDGIIWRTIFDSSISGIYVETPEGKTHLL